MVKLSAPQNISIRNLGDTEAIDEVEHGVASETIGPDVANLRGGDLAGDALLLVEQVVHLEAYCSSVVL